VLAVLNRHHHAAGRRQVFFCRNGNFCGGNYDESGIRCWFDPIPSLRSLRRLWAAISLEAEDSFHYHESGAMDAWKMHVDTGKEGRGRLRHGRRLKRSMNGTEEVYGGNTTRHSFMRFGVRWEVKTYESQMGAMENRGSTSSMTK